MREDMGDRDEARQVPFDAELTSLVERAAVALRLSIDNSSADEVEAAIRSNRNPNGVWMGGVVEVNCKRRRNSDVRQPQLVPSNFRKKTVLRKVRDATFM